ncbi:hypothetical protein HCX48_12735 [Rhodocyclus tenuis]|uniref:Uncharacterized protein n=2 Tax=Rhodocyclus TaxID=1064 RepID=A0A6L5JUL0_RHOTE|nr:hypothetical protein [Rhodocyclus gracilis]MQY50899.1 hypothetical protein [Rhodocyclus gracilis]MRD72873.1 hypothetical protein [Rhodocyclus gracilis]NJA90078.1 hypothetical protein [Rhodocyclus gracilis]
MHYQVTVAFGENRDYVFRFAESELNDGSPEEARRWFDREFADLECEPSNPVGKVLIIDKILNVARYGGEQHFIEADAWALRFARSAALVLAREHVRVDVAAFNIGY